MFNRIKELIWAVRYKSKVRQAKQLAELFNMTYFVIYMGGKLKVVPKRTLKDLIARRRFKRGTTIQDFEKRALFIARPGANKEESVCS